MAREKRQGAIAALIALVTTAVALTVTGAPARAEAPPVLAQAAASAAGASRFVGLAPERILDTRSGLGGSTHLGAGDTITLAVTGAGGVPGGASAVVLNLTATNSDGPGYVSVWPAGTERPTVSNVNVTGAGQTVANLAVVALPSSGELSVFSYAGADVVADVAGYFEPVAVSAAGRFVGQAPERILDTRPGAPLPAASEVPVAVAGHGGVPLAGASAVVMTITATEALAPGYVTAWPSGQERPTASVLNLPDAGATVANLVVVPLGADGAVRLFTQSGAHLVADVAGYVTDASAPAGSDGLFVPLDPARIADSREGQGLGRLEAQVEAELGLDGAGGIPITGVDGVVVNLTVTEPDGPGFVTAWPAGAARPETSNVNVVEAGQTVAAAAIVTAGEGSAMGLWSYSGSHLVVDVAGWFIATTPRSNPSSPPSPSPAPSPTPAPTPGSGGSTFSFAVIPDTQNEVFAGEQRMQERVKWLLDNRQSQDLRWVLHSGDVHNWPTPDESQFSNMSSWLRPLDGVLPMMLTVGNHDTAAVCPGGSACPGRNTSVDLRDTSMWNKYYPPSRFGWQGVFEPGKSDNGWRTFSAGGKNWLILSFELWPRTSVIPWLEQVVASHPNHNVILLSHEILNSDGSLSYGNGGYGANSPAAVWAALDDYPNVQMTFSGHVGGEAANTSLTAVDGHKVATFMQAFHDSTYNPTRIVTVDTATGTISTRIVANYDRARGVNVEYEYAHHRATIGGMRFVG